jgi:hypothetical protein
MVFLKSLTLKKLFWWFNLPLLGLAAVYTLITHQFPLASFPFQLALVTCIPYAFTCSTKRQEKSIDDLVNEMSHLDDDSFLELQQTLNAMPLGHMRGLLKEAYSIEYQRRFVDIQFL